jgi:hypothetical protein
MKMTGRLTSAWTRFWAAGTLAIFFAAALLGPIGSTRGAGEQAPASAKQPGGAKGSDSKSPAKPAESPQAEPKARIAGDVVDESGRPVSGATVELLVGREIPSVLSGSDGSFVLEASTARTFSPMLRAKIDGGARQASEQWDQIDNIPAKVRLVLRAAREVAVTVVDAEQRPVAGATVAAMVFLFRLADEQETDAAGKAILRVPADSALQYVFAVKDDVGLDYFAYQRQGAPASNGNALAPDHREPVTLVLNGAKKVTVRVVDDRGKRLVGSLAYAWYFQKPKKGEHLNTGFHAFQTKTDDKGRAVFRNIPIDNEGPITFWSQNEDYSHQRANYEPGSASDEIELTVLPKLTVRGRVTLASNGRPVAGAEVLAVGDGYTIDNFRGTTRSRDDGSFEIRVDPDQYYMFAASLDRQVSPAVSCIVKPRESVGEIGLVLQDGIRVYGKVTAGKERRPLAGQYLYLYVQPEIEYHELAAEDQLPNPRGERKAISPRITRSARSDDEGKFEFFTAPGKHYVFLSGGGAPRQFELKDDSDYELELHSDQPPRVPFAARVVLKSDPQKGVTGATVFGVGTGPYAGFLNAVTDAEGKFTAERSPSEMVLIARTENGKMAGLMRINEDDRSCEIAVGPTTSARGRLIDSNTGEILPGRQLDYCARISDRGMMSSPHFGGSVTADDEGEFVISGLVPGWTYNLQLVVEKDAAGRPRRWVPAEGFAPEGEGVEELGDVLVAPPNRGK